MTSDPVVAAARDPAWFHFRWMLNSFYVWPVRWQGWALVAFAVLCGVAAAQFASRWPGPSWSFGIALAALAAAFIATIIRHAKAHYPDAR
jgi:hypothetical protein